MELGAFSVSLAVADLQADKVVTLVDDEVAVSFEAVARRCKARYVLGLSATVTRKAGLHPIIFMQCGPVRFRVDARRHAVKRPFSHRVVLRDTRFALPAALEADRRRSGASTGRLPRTKSATS